RITSRWVARISATLMRVREIAIGNRPTARHMDRRSPTFRKFPGMTRAPATYSRRMRAIPRRWEPLGSATAGREARFEPPYREAEDRAAAPTERHPPAVSLAEAAPVMPSPRGNRFLAIPPMV